MVIPPYQFIPHIPWHKTSVLCHSKAPVILIIRIVLESFDLPVGFKTHICIFCPKGPIDPVRLSDFKRLGDMAFNSRHTCKQEHIQNNQHVAEKYGIDLINKWDELRLLSLHRLVVIVHLWVGLHKDVYLYALEVSNFQIEDSMPIEPRKAIQKSLGLQDT